ncbi:heparan-alpha-glucosaminide N-acetyltransferase isoform X4 [Carica papaya]|uniref:heparan-alpha-glucosaminide N-acetyltransferase isoform X4 n=1 Tax=Carica papaya TaxID=3649 RepID=UPI000B8CEDE7|nr:heparan-alpha-glucosaminide N-acetyltransferase isoform X4 [Carica papaya]
MPMYESIKGYCKEEDEWRRKGAGRGSDEESKCLMNDKDRKCAADDFESALQISQSPRLPIAKRDSPLSLQQQQQQQQQTQRLVSLDVFRGLTVALMIVVDDIGGILPAINHSPWNGLTIADFVMPFFLFIVGVSLAFAYKKVSCRSTATRKAILRALKLLLLGLFLQGGFFHGIKNLTYGVDIEKMRWLGVLQRIAVAYLVAALCEIWLKWDDRVGSDLSLMRKYQYHWVVAFVLTTTYLSLLYGLYVPDWEYQIPVEAPSSAPPQIFSVSHPTLPGLLVPFNFLKIADDTGPACNAVGMIDRKVLGIHHLYARPIYARTKECSINSPDSGPLPPDAPSWCQAPFDPEGLLSDGHCYLLDWFALWAYHCPFQGSQGQNFSVDDPIILSLSLRPWLGHFWNASKQGSLFIQLYVCHCWCCWHSLCCNLCSG